MIKREQKIKRIILSFNTVNCDTDILLNCLQGYKSGNFLMFFFLLNNGMCIYKITNIYAIYIKSFKQSITKLEEKTTHKVFTTFKQIYTKLRIIRIFWRVT